MLYAGKGAHTHFTGHREREEERGREKKRQKERGRERKKESERVVEYAQNCYLFLKE